MQADDPEEPETRPDPLTRLDPRARRASRGSRIAVGGAIVCFVLVVAIAAVLSAATGEQGAVIGASAGADDGASRGGGSTDDGVGPDGRAPVLVHVLGAVARPGLVELASGARVVDAIAAAGGLAEGADPAGINLAREVADGEQLAVPLLGQAPAAAGTDASGGGSGGTGAGAGRGAAPADGLVHLNSATAADLDTLPRIGPALAERILDWRDSNGPFTSVEQLREISGIGDATFAGLVDLVAL